MRTYEVQTIGTLWWGTFNDALTCHLQRFFSYNFSSLLLFSFQHANRTIVHYMMFICIHTVHLIYRKMLSRFVGLRLLLLMLIVHNIFPILHESEILKTAKLQQSHLQTHIHTYVLRAVEIIYPANYNTRNVYKSSLEKCVKYLCKNCGR